MTGILTIDDVEKIESPDELVTTGIMIIEGKIKKYSTKIYSIQHLLMQYDKLIYGSWQDQRLNWSIQTVQDPHYYKETWYRS